MTIETDSVNEIIEHYGTKGMKWGVRKNIQRRSGEARSQYVEAKDAKWVDKVNANPKLSKVTRIAARDAKKQTKALKKDYKDRGLNIKKNSIARTRYDNELKDILQQSVDRASYKVHGSSPTGLKEIQIYRYADGSMSAVIGTRDNLKIRKQQRQIAKADVRKAKADAAAQKKKDDDYFYEEFNLRTGERTSNVKQSDQNENFLEHAAPTADEYEGLEFRLVLDDEGFVDDILTAFDDEGEEDLEQSDLSEDVDDFLSHYGIRGMRWGVRRSNPSSGGSSGSRLDDEEALAKGVKLSPKGEKALKEMAKDAGVSVSEFRNVYKVDGSSKLRKNEAKTVGADAATSKPKWQSPPPAKQVLPSKQADDVPVGPLYINQKKSGLFGKDQMIEVSKDSLVFNQLRTRAKTTGIQSLSNEEISALNKRAELLSKYNDKFPKPPKPFVNRFAGTAGKQFVEFALTEVGETKINTFVGARNPNSAVKIAKVVKVGRTIKPLYDAAKLLK